MDYLTVTRLRGTPGVPPYNETDWTSPASLDVDGCLFDPGGSVVLSDASRTPVVTTPTVYAPRSADITASDRLVVRGRTWAVDGDPAAWGETTDPQGLVVKLKAVTG